jgi:prepilin-type N-terminal cleavage/methylation domain-containing protein
MKESSMRQGFTFIELLFVIVVLGIVGGMTMEAVRGYYEGVYRSGEYTKRIADADHILEVTSKYFENGLNDSIVNIAPDGGTTCTGAPVAGDTADHTIAFIGVDVEAMRSTGGAPGWSEETRAPTVLLTGGYDNILVAPDVNYSSANAVISARSGGALGIGNTVLYDHESLGEPPCTRFGFTAGGLNDGYHIFTMTNDTTLTLDANNTASDGLQKYLLNSGYAFGVLNTGEFVMWSNFRPWAGQLYTAGTRSTLGENVAHFYVSYDMTNSVGNANVSTRGRVWTLKICMKGLDANLDTANSTEAEAICRERSVHVRY